MKSLVSRPPARRGGAALVGVVALIAVIGLLILPTAGQAARADDGRSTGDDEAFERRVRPILAGVCFRCHGGAKTSGGLRVDSRAALLEGGDSGPAIVPGDPDASPLIAAVRHEGGLRMPPPGRLRPEEIAALEDWVRRGTAWPQHIDLRGGPGGGTGRHWAFEPVAEVRPPESPGGPAHPIDRFADRARTAGIAPDLQPRDASWRGGSTST